MDSFFFSIFPYFASFSLGILGFWLLWNVFNEKTPLAYILGVMNMILHGIHNPNISKQNTLRTDIRGIQEKDRFDIILANPPFGGKEKDQIQSNFPIKTTATEMLFIQHITKNLGIGDMFEWNSPLNYGKKI